MSPRRNKPGRADASGTGAGTGAALAQTRGAGTPAAASQVTLVPDDESTGEDGSAVADRSLPMRAFSRSLPMELLRARESVMRRFRPALRTHGVTEQQWRILRALAHAGPLEVSALAEATYLLAPSLSRILPDLEARQLISRRQADSDLRRSVISLERKGLRLIAMHAPQAEDIYAKIAERFGPERLSRLFTLLRELEDALDDPEAGTSANRARSRPRTAASRKLR